MTINRFAVPCFIMITGCLLLNPKKKIDNDKIKSYISRMLLILISFGFAFAFIETYISSDNKNMSHIFLFAISNLIQGNAWEHMWYIYCLIGLYILTPFLRKFTEHAKIKEAKDLLISLFLFTTLIPTINFIFHLKISTFYLEGLNYLFIFLCGYYITNTDIFSDKHIYIGGIIGIIGYALCCYFNIYHSQLSVFMILETVFIVRLFSSEKIKIKPNKFINIISKYSFSIYLVHCFWLNLLNKGFHIYPDILPPIIGEITFYIYALVLSLITSIMLYKIPILKKILK